MIKINCIICGKQIVNPQLRQLSCGSKECRDSIRKEKAFEWKEGHRDRYNKYQRDYYQKYFAKKREEKRNEKD